MRLNREFYLQDAYSLAQALLGKVICFKNEKYRIVETEAYGGAYDKACHAYNFKRTKRTESLYLIGGYLYIYLIYGMYNMLNITANKEGVPEAVLIRAVEPLNFNAKKSKTNGPGKLCKELGIDRSLNQCDLVMNDEIYIDDDGFKNFEVVSSKRINIDYAMEDKERLWRFYVKNNQHISKI